MLRILYSALFYLLVPVIFLRVLKRSLKEPRYRQDLAQRLGFFRSKHAGKVVWIHAVSAGETVAAVPMIRRLRAGGYRCLVTNMTPTGRDRVDALLPGEVENCYVPYDLPGSIARFIRRNQPLILIVIDTELWPNIIHQCQLGHVKIAVVNGRLSANSARGYAKIAQISKPMFGAIDLIACQTKAHAERYIKLGANPDITHVTGGIKFDATESPGLEPRILHARAITGERPVLIGASTHATEEAALLLLLPALRHILPDVLLILAPRHTYRCDAVVQLCQAAGEVVVKLSEVRAGNAVTTGSRVLLLDSMGELEAFYRVARVAFVGGSLIPRGGHNLLEAVRAGSAVVMGPHLENIEDIAQQFIDLDAMVVVADEAALNDVVIRLMCEEGMAQRMSVAALAVLSQNQGSLDRVELLLKELLGYQMGQSSNTPSNKSPTNG